jgi:hypothetical protein
MHALKGMHTIYCMLPMREKGSDEEQSKGHPQKTKRGVRGGRGGGSEEEETEQEQEEEEEEEEEQERRRRRKEED